MKSLVFSVTLLLVLRGSSPALPAAANPHAASRRDVPVQAGQSAAAVPAPRPSEATISLHWQGTAKLRRAIGKTSGTLIVNAAGLEFRPGKGNPSKWSFMEIETLDIGSHRLVLTSYERGGRFRLGVRRFRFDLQDGIPPEVAAELVHGLDKPSRNRVPDPKAAAFGTIAAHHHTPRGGSNGVLRFHVEGVDYITSWSDDSRSWRWSDIEALSSLDPYHLVLSGRLETYSFQLKEPLSRDLFDRLWDEVYAHRSAGWRSGGRIEP